MSIRRSDRYRTALRRPGFSASILALTAAGLTLGLALGFSVVSFPSYAAESGRQPQAELDAVTAAIADIQTWLEDARSTYSTEESNLQKAELEITAASRQITAVETQLTATRLEQSQLQAEMETLNGEKAAQDALLQQMLRAAYMRGDQSVLKLLLNQEDFSQSARLLQYYRIFSESQLQLLDEYATTLEEITQLDQSLAESAQRLTQQQTQLQQKLTELERGQQAKAVALAELQKSIATRSSELEQLQIDQSQLQQLVNEIHRAIELIPTPADASPFINQRGRLPMPVSGDPRLACGSRYGDGNLRRQGITIAASEGTPVQAVHAGRVVFADWLRGSGLLLIVDHGDGYMSLYGNNEALAATAGDRVSAGDILATSGKTSDSGTSGVYFEIRHRGVPQDPAEWLEGID